LKLSQEQISYLKSQQDCDLSTVSIRLSPNLVVKYDSTNAKFIATKPGAIDLPQGLYDKSIVCTLMLDISVAGENKMSVSYVFVDKTAFTGYPDTSFAILIEHRVHRVYMDWLSTVTMQDNSKELRSLPIPIGMEEDLLPKGILDRLLEELNLARSILCEHGITLVWPQYDLKATPKQSDGSSIQ